MKTKINQFLKENYKNLSEKEINSLADKMLSLLPVKTHKLCEIGDGTVFKYKGYEFTKLDDEEESCYCLLNDTIFESQFGETNDWAKSIIRERLNEFDGKGNSKVLPDISKDDLARVSLNYYAYKIPNGRTEDMITCLSWEEVYAYKFPNFEKDSWLRSGNYGYAYGAYLLNTSGGDYNSYTDIYYAVRPALHFRKDLEVEI